MKDYNKSTKKELIEEITKSQRDVTKMSKKQLIEELNKPEVPEISITDNTFTAVTWDENASESVNNVAKALLNLTELYKAQNISIECMLKIENKE